MSWPYWYGVLGLGARPNREVMGFLLSSFTYSEATPMAKACGVVLFVGSMATLSTPAPLMSPPKCATTSLNACLSNNCEQDQGRYRKQQHNTQQWDNNNESDAGQYCNPGPPQNICKETHSPDRRRCLLQGGEMIRFQQFHLQRRLRCTKAFQQDFAYAN